MKAENEKYCHECGKIINVQAEICPECGVRQPDVKTPSALDVDNKWLMSLLLCWFLGVLGVHRFYLGHTATGIVQLITLGGCGIWSLIDLILIATGNFKDADGNPVTQK